MIFFFFRFAAANAEYMLCFVENTSATVLPRIGDFPVATSGTDGRQFTLMAESDSFDCLLLALRVGVIPAHLFHSGHFHLYSSILSTFRSTMDHAVDWHINSVCAISCCVRSGWMGIPVSTWNDAAPAKLHFISFFSVHTPCHYAAARRTTPPAWTENKMEKWKPKHINNYGSETEGQDWKSARERRELFLEFCRTFFPPETTLVHNYLLLPFTINNKWMEATKKNICKSIFHLINSCRCFLYLSLSVPAFALLGLLIVVSFLVWKQQLTCCGGRRNDALETQ